MCLLHGQAAAGPESAMRIRVCSRHDTAAWPRRRIKPAEFASRTTRETRLLPTLDRVDDAFLGRMRAGCRSGGMEPAKDSDPRLSPS